MTDLTPVSGPRSVDSAKVFRGEGRGESTNGEDTEATTITTRSGLANGRADNLDGVFGVAQPITDVDMSGFTPGGHNIGTRLWRVLLERHRRACGRLA